MEVLLGAVIPAIVAQIKKIPGVANQPLAKFGIVLFVALLMAIGYGALTGGQIWPVSEATIQMAVNQALVAIGVKAVHKNVTGG